MASSQTTVDEFISKRYDYIVIGGGTAGLVVAARLTEDPSVSVAVLEAGENHLSDPMVQIPYLYSQLYENPKYDWIFKTVRQTHLRNDIHGWPRGKGLGGSSAINYSMYSQASKADLDRWVSLGNPGWGFDDLLPYYRKAETYTEPTDAVSKIIDYSLNSQLRGSSGPIQVSFPKTLEFVQEIWAPTWRNLGFKMADPREGHSITAHQQPLTMDPSTGMRSYAATAYYAPNAARPNLSVLTGAAVSKIIVEAEDGQPNATGVEFTVGESKYVVGANREVILSAGAVQSPQLLELSGIGSPGVLKPLGIPVLVENMGVGENLQDHLVTGCSWQVLDELRTLEEFRDDPTKIDEAIAEFFAVGTGMFSANNLTSTTMASYSQLELNGDRILDKNELQTKIDTIFRSTKVGRGLQKQYDLQREILLDPNQASITYVGVPCGASFMSTESGAGIYVHDNPGKYVSIVNNLQHPCSRGTIHIKSTDVNEHPVIDPKYLSHPVDSLVLEAGFEFLAKVIKTEPLASKLKGGYAMKGYENFDKKNYHELVKDTAGTQWHPCGTNSMLPKEDGGVVDAELRVYGVKNLRVVDASVFPLLPQGNLQSLVYAVAEKAADLLKMSQ
ncbi:hypothetical protein V8C42DRAFT_352204 [Trichoderma barbatum]